jgi:hypothetical protein
MNHSLALVSSACVKHTITEAQIAQRLVLYRGELYRVPAEYRMLRIKSGTAYVTQAGQDRIVLCGQTTPLETDADVALISTLAGEPVIVELF